MHGLQQTQVAARVCEFCNVAGATLSHELHEFDYGNGADAVALSVPVPVWSCAACGEQVMDGEAEDLIHETVCRHLGRLTPGELRTLRSAFALRQEDLAALTGYGTASIKRWEAGSQIQSEAVDKHLRLVRSFGIDAVRNRTRALPTPQFRTEISPALQRSAATFQLRARPAVAMPEYAAA